MKDGNPDPVLNAAQSVLDAESEGDVAIQAILVVVGMDNEGEKWISHKRSNDLRTWEARGMIEDVRDSLAAIEVARMFEDDET